ncbi:hypothetical protein HZ326_11686 [Fusarium oxysporum f. sp. albedinis]|nr:hypothetical protein HZ326_11686 [Fusarium oxysporum f. sp. albedinis]
MAQLVPHLTVTQTRIPASGCLDVCFRQMWLGQCTKDKLKDTTRYCHTVSVMLKRGISPLIDNHNNTIGEKRWTRCRGE